MIAAALAAWAAVAAISAQGAPAGETAEARLDEAHRLFYIGRYDEAARLALTLRPGVLDPLSTFELRTSALHFRLKRALAGSRDKKAALRACAECTQWVADLKSDIDAGRSLAQTRLKQNAQDDAALFFLGKINLTHVWLHLETLGQRTGWGEYWEARRSLDTVLERQPDHIRAQVSRAWIDYIVDTRVPFMFRWVLGGGDKKGALLAAGKAAAKPADLYTRAEAGFAYWEMLAREKRRAEAVVVARALLADFPENAELAKFIDGK